MSQCQVFRPCQPSQPLNPDKIQQKVDLTIPKGGSISFEYVKENGKKGSVSDFSDNTLSYVNSEGLYELRKGEDGKHRVNITGEIESLKAVIKNANGTVSWSGDLVEVGKSAEKKPEDKVKEPIATEVRPKEGSSTEGALVDYGPLRLPLPDASRSVNNAPLPQPRPEVLAPDLAGPLRALGFSSGPESAEQPSLKVNIPAPMDSLELVPVPEGEPTVKPAPMLDDGSEHLLAPSTNDIADELFGKLDAGAKAPEDSGLISKGIDSSEVSPFEEVSSGKSVAKASPATEELSKQEPKVNTLDLTKLEPGSKLHFRVQGDPLGHSASANVPKNATDPLVSARGNFIPNEDGTFKFVVDPGQNLKFFIPGKEDGVVKNAGAESSPKVSTPISANQPAPLTAKQIRKEERAQDREDRKLELSDGTKIKLGGKPTELTGAQVEEFLQKYPDQKAVVIATALGGWCQGCNNYVSGYEEYSRSSKNVAVIKVNVDDANSNSAFMVKYNVSLIPATFYKENESLTFKGTGPKTRLDLKTSYGD